tara:strand:+ start:263 stop:871 length:609 start_codon:yes stop_codon:yes gene_type:complete
LNGALYHNGTINEWSTGKLSSEGNPNALLAIVDEGARLLNWLLSVVITISFGISFFSFVWQAAGRWFARSPDWPDMPAFFMAWALLLAIALAFGKQQHMICPLAPASPARQKRLFMLVPILAVAVFSGWIMLANGSKHVLIAKASGMMMTGFPVPQYFASLCLPVSGALILFYCLRASLHIVLSDNADESPTGHRGQPVTED